MIHNDKIFTNNNSAKDALLEIFLTKSSNSVAVASAITKAAGLKGWVEEARTYLAYFDKQHPLFGIEADVERYVADLAYDCHEKRHRNKSCGSLNTFAYIKSITTHTRKWSWVSDREANYFACHNRNSNIVYFELPAKKGVKISLYKETIKSGTEFALWFAAIRNETNAERQREMIERVGEDKYLEKLGGKTIHEDTDSKGNSRKLIEINNYSFACRRLLVVRVVCPSTNRVYFLKPVKQNSKTCEEAVASTFRNPISFRHGDVGLVAVDENGKILEQQLINES